MKIPRLGLIGVLLISSMVYADPSGLKALSNQELSQVQGQGGADLSLSLSLNQAVPTGSGLSNTYACANGANQYCRLALAFNNRQDQNGNLYWLVFKKIQGTLAIDKFQLDGTTVTVNTNQYRSALKLTFLDEYPIQIRNLGFEALSIETDTGTADSQKGYLSTFVPSTYTGFDQGLERGFMGVNINANLALSGSVKVFSCNGSATSRC
ncbi:hypothetical protein [Acinetobacter soli]|uniref:hypothetical protein n=1 Tax=Acinetobacter soli TaxID=487316 RepID=UPI00300CDD90